MLLFFLLFISGGLIWFGLNWVWRRRERGQGTGEWDRELRKGVRMESKGGRLEGWEIVQMAGSRDMEGFCLGWHMRLGEWC